MEEWTPFVDRTLKPAEADFEIADTPRPMGVNLSAKAIELNGHILSGAIEDDDGSDEIETLEGLSRANAGGF